MQNNSNICLLCGSPAALKHKNYPGYQEPDTFQIFHCENCNTAFSSPRIESSSIYEIIYKNADKIPGYERYWKYLQIIKNYTNPLEYLSETEDTYWGVNEALSLLVKDKKTSNILEIGSGLGYLTYSLNKANYQTLGLDISQTAVNQAIDNFGDHFICADLFEYAIAHAESYDIIILTEVIEHVENPVRFIESIKKLLKPNGNAIITTPNKSFFQDRILWSFDQPPVHFWWFSEESITQLAKNAGMDIRFMDFSNYYKNRYTAFDMKKLHDGPLPQPIFNQHGELLVHSMPTPGNSKSHFRSIISKVPFVKNIYRKLKESFNKNLVVCGQRGTVLCAMLQKPQKHIY